MNTNTRITNHAIAGLCCEYGQGYFTVSSGGNVYVLGSTFGESITRDFRIDDNDILTVPSPPPPPPATNCAGTCAVVALTIQADDFPQEVEWALKVVQNADVDAGGNAPGSVSVPVSATVCDTVPITNRGRIASGTLPDLTPGVFFQQEISGICTSTEYEIQVLDSFGDGTSRERMHPFPRLSTG